MSKAEKMEAFLRDRFSKVSESKENSTDWQKGFDAGLVSSLHFVREFFASKEEESNADSLCPVSRAELERAWVAYGFMAFCGTVHDTKIGVVTRDLQTLGRGFKTGDVVFYREYETALSVERPIDVASLGKSGFIAGVGTTVGIPKHCVSPIDPRSVVDIR